MTVRDCKTSADARANGFSTIQWLRAFTFAEHAAREDQRRPQPHDARSRRPRGVDLHHDIPQQHGQHRQRTARVVVGGRDLASLDHGAQLFGDNAEALVWFGGVIVGGEVHGCDCRFRAARTSSPEVQISSASNAISSGSCPSRVQMIVRFPAPAIQPSSRCADRPEGSSSTPTSAHRNRW